jgi:hypothetical protein
MSNDRNRESGRNSDRAGREDEPLRNPGTDSGTGDVEPGQTEAGSSRRGESETGGRGRSEFSEGGSGASRRGSNPSSNEEENPGIEQPGEE